MKWITKPRPLLCVGSSPSDAGALVRALTQFSHLTADTIVNGSATAHSAPVDHADRKNDQSARCSHRYRGAPTPLCRIGLGAPLYGP